MVKDDGKRQKNGTSDDWMVPLLIPCSIFFAAYSFREDDL
jgi:hypothetical protein